MAVTPREKAKATMIAKHGSEEAWLAWMREVGSQGGKAKVPTKGFGSMSKERLVEVARKATASRWRKQSEK